MFNFNQIIILIAIFTCAIQNVKCETSSTIPQLLLPCYRQNFTVVARPPLTLPLLLELIRKIEMDSQNSLNMRMLTTTLLHSVEFDGITKGSNHFIDNLIIPYAPSGSEFFKYKLLTNYLIPGDYKFPIGSLNQNEFCFLHYMVSNSINKWKRGDEATTCFVLDKLPADKNNAIDIEDEEDADEYSVCPEKKGNIHTKWGTVSVSHILAGVASALQSEKVSFQRVAKAMNKNETEQPTSTSNANVDNVWVSTIAKDLAEVILNQATLNPVIGTHGSWNDTILPRAYYLDTNHYGLTEAELLAAIDGVILGSKVNDWTQKLDTIRLSQIIDMYYSDRGVVYTDGYNANNRSLILNDLIQNIHLEEQVSESAKLLKGMGAQYESTLTDNDIATLVPSVIKLFKSNAETSIKKYESVEYLSGKQMMSPIELIVILDGSHDAYHAQQILYSISEAIQVSQYGSKIGIINGQSADWMSSINSDLFQLFTDFEQATDNWPRTLSLESSLKRVIDYYQNKSSNCSDQSARPLGQSILIFSQDGRLSDSEKYQSQKAISSIKSTYPETKILYVSADENNALRDLASRYSDILIKPTSDLAALIDKVTEQLSQIPANILKYYCKDTSARFEDYITPGRQTLYEIHNDYLRKAYTTKFSNNDYGDLSICVTTNRSSPENKVCEVVTVNGEISFNSEQFCTKESNCNLRYVVTANNSQFKCAENDCRYPDQVRLIITYSGRAVAGFIPNLVLIISLYMYTYVC